jgi:hypothetical protein
MPALLARQQICTSAACFLMPWLMLWLLLLWLQAQGHNLTRVLATNPQQFPPTVQHAAVRLRVSTCQPALFAGVACQAV